MRYPSPMALHQFRDDDEPDDDLDELDKLTTSLPAPTPQISNQISPHPPYELANSAEYEDYALDKENPTMPSSLEDGQTRPAKSNRASLRHQPPPHAKRVIFIGTASLIGLAYLIMFFAAKGTRYDHDLQINVILMISDGFGPASEAFSRGFVQHLQSLPPSQQTPFLRWTFPETEPHPLKKGPLNQFGALPLDPLLVGSSRTRSSNSLVTDSAAGATAFACGIKSYNGAIAVEPDRQEPCGTVLEAAKHRGYLTGLVATSRITHATPASFYAHVIDRNMESKIATFMTGTGPLGRSVDLAFGGGRSFFLSNSSSSSSRSDDQDLLSIAEAKFGFTILNKTEDFEKAWNDGAGKIKTPVLGLFHDDHMNYEIDRISLEGTEKREPSLRNMSLAALQTLSKEAKAKSAHGFFLMIEGSRIDMAAHSNDPVGHLYDILAYQETVRTVKTWVDEANKAGWPTLMISVSDHETGGLALGRQLTSQYPNYAWYPDALLNATHSTAWLADSIRAEPRPLTRQFVVDKILRDGLGIVDATNEEIGKFTGLAGGASVDYLLADMVSRRAQVGWSTHGHSGVDVNLYAYPPEMTKDLVGNRENTDIGQFIVEAMQIDLGVVTKDLNRLAKSWHVTDESSIKSGQNTHLEHYHHDF